MLLLNGECVRQSLPMAAAIEGMKTAFAQLSGGHADVPLRTHLRVAEYDGDVLVMPAMVAGEDSAALAVKVVSVFPQNEQLGLPRIHAAVLLFDSRTGETVACLEGGTLTAIRTAAASGAATDLLANRHAASLAILGSGVQARTHLEAVCAVRNITSVRVFSRTQRNVEKFIDEMPPTKSTANIRPAATAQEAIADADIICTTTTSTTPVFEDAAVKSGCHINAVGSYKPAVAEIPAATVQRSLVFVDERSSAWEEAGDLIQPLKAGLISRNHIHAELGELVLGNKTGRRSAEQITLFKSVGTAVQDAIAAKICFENARKHGVGQVVPW